MGPRATARSCHFASLPLLQEGGARISVEGGGSDDPFLWEVVWFELTFRTVTPRMHA